MPITDINGNGPPLVLVHAFPFSRKMWRGVTPALSKRFRVVATDLPGFGDAPVEREGAAMEDMAQHILTHLGRAGITEPAIFGGVSMGGYVLFEVMRRASERVKGLVLAGTRAAADTEESRQQRYQLIERVRKEGAGILAGKMIPKLFSEAAQKEKRSCVDEAAAWILEAPTEGLCAALFAMANRPDSTPDLPKISVPTMVLAGEEDALVPPAEMRAMAEKIPGARFRLLPKTGHLLNVESPTMFAEEILRFAEAKPSS